MTEIEQVHIDYIKANIIPILEGYIGDEVNPETIKKMEDKIVEMLKSQIIQHDWEVRIDNEKINYATLMD
jgi:hypothetical protein